MGSPTNRIEVTLESVLDSVDLAEDISLRVAVTAGFDEDARDRIGMSVREGMINAVTYGNRGDRDKLIFLSLELDGNKMTIRILDQGAGFRLEDLPDPLAEENILKTSGRGIFLIRAFMDEFEVRPGVQGGAELVMAKRLPVPAGRAK